MKSRTRLLSAAVAAPLALAFTFSPVRVPAQPVWGTALAFDGVDDYVDLPDDTWFTGDFTIECWVFVRSYNNGSRLLDFGNGAGIDNVVLALSEANSGRPNFYAWNGTNGNGFTAPLPLPTNQWIHLAATLSGSTGSLYVNGTNVASGPLGVPRSVVRTNNFIGRSNWGSDGYANMVVDEIRVWSIVRSEAAIREGMAQPLTGAETGLVAYWRLNEGTGIQVNDATGHGKRGTLVNRPPWVASFLPPGVTLNGANPLTNEWHTPYVEPGVTVRAAPPVFAAGYLHGLALKADGTVTGWGSVGYDYQLFPIPASASNAVAVAAGYYHGLALRADGTVAAWGAGMPGTGYGHPSYGQCTVPASATNVIALAPGYYHNLALRAAGSVIAWGRTNEGQTVIPLAATNVVAIAAGYMHSLALRADGAVLAWGTNNYGQISVPASATNVVALAAGAYHSLALRADGTVVGWGAGRTNTGSLPEYGQAIIPAAATNVVAIVAGLAHSMALKADSTVIAWGAGQTNTGVAPVMGQCIVPATATGVVAVVAGAQHSLALRGDGSIIGWGRDLEGQLAVPSTLNQLSFPLIIGGAVNVDVPGTYDLAYYAPNTRGGIGEARRTVVVVIVPPAVSTLPPSRVASTDAVLEGLANPNGVEGTAWFEWGRGTSYGQSTTPVSLGSGEVPVSFSNILSGLIPSVTYHYRAVGSNSAGLSFGLDQSFTTPLLIVTTLNDGGAGSLRQAIADATPGTLIQVPLTGTLTLTNELLIAKELVISGPGATNLALSGNHSNRVCVITNAAIVSLSGLTIRDGHASDGADGVNGTSGSGRSGLPGGGIYNLGILTLTDCAVSSNSAGYGGRGGSGAGGVVNGSAGGNGGNGGNGGGIFNWGALTMNRCAVYGNSAGTGASGGAGGAGTIMGSDGSGGWGGAGGQGGAIYSDRFATLTLNNCTFSGNFTGGGGRGGTGGGWRGSGGGGGNGGNGGALCTLHWLTNATLVNCTVTASSTGDGGLGGTNGFGWTLPGNPGQGGIGGGMYAEGINPELLNTIIALNSTPTNAPDVMGNFLSRGHNLIGVTDGSTGFGANGDVLNMHPMLLPLDYYGGPTPNHVPALGSPALEAGDDAVLSAPYNLTTDQRGRSRKAGYHVDIGAMERGVPGVTPPVVTTGGALMTATNPVSGTLTALLQGSVSAGGAALCTTFFEYGLSTSYGGSTTVTNVYYSAGLMPVSNQVSGLAAGLPFHYRAVASNVAGITYGADLVLFTSPLLPHGDANGDGVVDQTELDAVLQNYWPTSPWLQMTNLVGLGGSNVIFALTNTTAGAFTVESSTNLLDWQHLGPAAPFYYFLDTNAPALPQRFYRLRWP